MFTVYDYVVFVGMLGVSASIGLYYACSGGKQATTKEFLLADRSMGAFPVSLSMLASFMSAITVLGTPAEMYMYGSQYCLIFLGYAIMIPMAAYLFLPVFYNLRLTSVFEYLEMRYDRGIRVIISVWYIIQTMLYMAIVLYTPSLALVVVTGVNVWISILGVGIICTIYTALGGMKAVMWTDTFQIVIMFLGLFAIIIKGSVDHGGFANIYQLMADNDRIHYFDFSFDPRVRHSVWALSIGAAFTWAAIYGVNQAQVQRALCCPTLKTGQIALWVNFPGLTLLLMICCMCGFVVFAEYHDCDPLQARDNITKDQLLPLYVIEHLKYPCIPGLFTASVFSGALSTISSGLNSLAAVVLQDMIKPLCAPNISESRATTLSKFIAIFFGILMIILTWVASKMGGVLQAALSLFGIIGGPTMGVFLMAMLNPYSNKYGAYAGFFSALSVTMWIGMCANLGYKSDRYAPPLYTTGCENQTTATSSYLSSAATTTDYYISSAATTTDYYTSSEATTDFVTSAPFSTPEDRPLNGLYDISYLWYSLIATVIVNVVGMLVSWATGLRDRKSVCNSLLTPLFYKQEKIMFDEYQDKFDNTFDNAAFNTKV